MASSSFHKNHYQKVSKPRYFPVTQHHSEKNTPISNETDVEAKSIGSTMAPHISSCDTAEDTEEEASSSPVLSRKSRSRRIISVRWHENKEPTSSLKDNNVRMSTPTCRKMKTITYAHSEFQSPRSKHENVFSPFRKKLKSNSCKSPHLKVSADTLNSPVTSRKCPIGKSPSSVFMTQEDSFHEIVDFDEIDSLCSSAIFTPKRSLSNGGKARTPSSRRTTSYNFRLTPQRTDRQKHKSSTKGKSKSGINTSHLLSPDLFEEPANEMHRSTNKSRKLNMEDFEHFRDQIGDMFENSFEPEHDLVMNSEVRITCVNETLSNSSSVFSLPAIIQTKKSVVTIGCVDKADKSDSLTDIPLESISTTKNQTPSKASPDSNSENDSQISFASTIDSQPLIGRLQGRLKGLQPSQPAVLQTETERRVKAVTAAFEEAVKVHESGKEYEAGPFFGLPSLVAEVLEKQRGITKLYDWQKECITKGCDKNNLLFSLPTSGGKTLVAEVLMLRQLLLKRKDTLLILPYVALVQEKVHGLSPFGVELGFLIEEYAGSKGVFPPKTGRKKRVLYIATIEKASGLVNSLLSDGRIDELGLVVTDEVHMLGEGSGRGATLEIILTKLRYTAPSVQLVAMSATIGNLKELAIFLDAELYTGNFRPVSLKEYVKIERDIYELNPAARREEELLGDRRLCSFPYTKEQLQLDVDKVGGLVGEVIPDHSCIVFCPTRRNCETLAELISRVVPNDLTKHRRQEKKALYRAITEEGGGKVCPTLRKTIPFGVAYHHSGLTEGERRLIEEGYILGTLCCLCCTSTLAAGVNLPARRVIIRAPYTGMEFLTRSRYKQMVGRAGRAGLDTHGESFLMLQQRDRLLAGKLLLSPMEVCHSTLAQKDDHGLVSLLFTSLGLGIAVSLPTLKALTVSTLLALQSSVLQVDVNAKVLEIVENLRKRGLVYIKNLSKENVACESPTSIVNIEASNENDSVFISVESKAEHEKIVLNRPVMDSDELAVSRLGKATIKGNISLDVAGRLYRDLLVARESLAVNSHLHLLYLVVPYDLATSIKVVPNILSKLFLELGEEEVKVANLLNITEGVLMRLKMGQRSKKVNELVIKRFYVSLILHQMWTGTGVWEVADLCQVDRGFIQQLLLASSAFASCVHHFCEELEELWAFRDLLLNFSRQLSGCCSAELLPLLDLPAVKKGRAKMLYRAGFRTLHDIANANPRDMSASVDHLPYRTATQIINSAKMLLLEKAESLQGEADEVLSRLHYPTTTNPVPRITSEAPSTSKSTVPS